VVRAKLDIALWSGLYVIYNPMVSFDLRCQSGICIGKTGFFNGINNLKE